MLDLNPTIPIEPCVNCGGVPTAKTLIIVIGVGFECPYCSESYRMQKHTRVDSRLELNLIDQTIELWNELQIDASILAFWKYK